MKKKCSKCKEEKELSEFNKRMSAKDGINHYCRSCTSIMKKSTYNYNKSRNIRILHSYKLSVDELENLYILQNGKCKICNIEYPSISKHGGLYIDHCHKTKKVRGLLCSKCNMILGFSNDDVSILKASIDYLNIYYD